MQAKTLVIVLCMMVAAGTLQAADDPSVPQVGPPFAKVEALWKGFWTAVIRGDVDQARRHVYRQHLFPQKITEEAKDLAHQMSYCHLDPPAYAAGPDEVFYVVCCKYGEETAVNLVGLRRVADGVWLFHLL